MATGKGKSCNQDVVKMVADKIFATIITKNNDSGNQNSILINRKQKRYWFKLPSSRQNQSRFVFLFLLHWTIHTKIG